MGLCAWGAYNSRLMLRALHMLQVEGYETRRYLRWTTRRWKRWVSGEGAGMGISFTVLGLCYRGLALRNVSLAAAAWAFGGVWLWRRTRFPAGKKPLVLTARAKRLLAGQLVLAIGAALAPFARRGAVADRITTFSAIVAGLSLVVPLITVIANVALWPVEEAFRRFYLKDARRVLRQYDPTVIAVAGSYGKTSTKEFLGTILSRRWTVLKPPGSYNTPMGLSRVIREQLRPDHEVFVTELGDYSPDDIRLLTDLVHPRIGVLTTIGPEHLDRFKSLDRIIEAKE
jgi:UDP-N-acetylmuramoyl-tripeptide--D-alanyl-D-alanine ligase